MKIKIKNLGFTRMAVVTALATTPGSACQVPNPTEGILAPVFNSKNFINFAILFFLNNNNKPF